MVGIWRGCESVFKGGRIFWRDVFDEVEAGIEFEGEAQFLRGEGTGSEARAELLEHVREQEGEWFEQQGTSPNYVLYWAPKGHVVTEKEIKEHLDHLGKYGPTPYAFTFQQPFGFRKGGSPAEATAAADGGRDSDLSEFTVSQRGRRC